MYIMQNDESFYGKQGIFGIKTSLSSLFNFKSSSLSFSKTASSWQNLSKPKINFNSKKSSRSKNVKSTFRIV